MNVISGCSGIGGIDYGFKKAGWKIKSPFCGVVNGISRGVDSYEWKEQIKALGNAVVPQVAEEIAEFVKTVIQWQDQNQTMKYKV